MKELIEDITKIPYISKYSELQTFDNSDNCCVFNNNNNNNQEIKPTPFNVENLNNKFYFFLNSKNIVEYVGSMDNFNNYNTTEKNNNTQENKNNTLQTNNQMNNINVLQIHYN